MDIKKWMDRVARLVRDERGPLTQELVRAPGGFGLGQVPVDRVPDSTTTSVCGYCSTGCGLKIHLKDGVAINLSPRSSAVRFTPRKPAPNSLVVIW